jgi:tetratricopeptide (TPR) repeat protein
LVQERFQEALATVPDEGSPPAGKRLVLRGDAFRGLGDRQAALASYRHALRLRPGDAGVLARIGDCLMESGETAEAMVALAQLASQVNQTGNELLAEGKADAAAGQYQRVVELLSRMVEKHGRVEWRQSLATALGNRGNACLMRMKPQEGLDPLRRAIQILESVPPDTDASAPADLAIAHQSLGDAHLLLGELDPASSQYRKAIATWPGTGKGDGPSPGPDDLGVVHLNLGNALLGNQTLNEAHAQFDRAVALLAGGAPSLSNIDRAMDLASAHNNRGVIHRARGRLGQAIEDFDRGIAILETIAPGATPARDAPAPARPGVLHSTRVRTDVVIGISGKSIDVLTRPRLAGHGAPPEVAVSLAVGLRNRGSARMAEGKPGDALTDLERGLELLVRLHGVGGKSDLAPQLAKALSSLAWIYATHPDIAIRNGRKATEYATSACELSEWKSSSHLESLAAAFAERGDFTSAVQWQERSIQTAPPEQQAGLASRLRLYQSAAPYRAPALP